MKEKAERIERETIRLTAALEREEQERIHLAEQKRKEEQEDKERLEAVKAEQKRREKQQNELEKGLANLHHIDEANEKRQSEITAHIEVVGSSLELLQRGVASGRVKQDYICTPSGAYTLTCDNCFSNIASEVYCRYFSKGGPHLLRDILTPQQAVLNAIQSEASTFVRNATSKSMRFAQNQYTLCCTPGKSRQIGREDAPEWFDLPGEKSVTLAVDAKTV